MQVTGDLFAVWLQLQGFCKDNHSDPDFECFVVIGMGKQTVLRLLATGEYVGEDPGDMLLEVADTYRAHPELVVK
jgi:hypothetical protein